MDEYLHSLPPLKRGKYRVKFLKDTYGVYERLIGKANEEGILINDGLKPKNCSMGSKHYAGCINQDGGMSPSDLFVPGIDLEILEFLN